MAETSQPTGEGIIACVQRDRECYYFPFKLSLEPACKEQEKTKWAPKYRPRRLEELGIDLTRASGKVTESLK
jgi:hypothetical protein